VFINFKKSSRLMEVVNIRGNKKNIFHIYVIRGHVLLLLYYKPSVKNGIKRPFVYIRVLGVENIKRTCKRTIFEALYLHFYFNLYPSFPFFPPVSARVSLYLSVSVSITLSTPDLLSLHPAAATETSTRENIDC
jgi:hypothetical protein